MKKVLFILLVCLSSYYSQSQNDSGKNILLYLDCQSYCDQAFIKREIPFVDYVNDRFQSNVYILVNSQATGSGGREYKLQFIGQGAFAGVDDTLSFIRPATATDDESRKLMVQTLKLGLVKYLARTEKGNQLQISFEGPTEGKETENELEEKDPWNLWVFNIRLNGYLNGDQNYFSNSFTTGLSASRISEEYKTTTNLSYRVNSNRYGEGEDSFEFTNEFYNFSNTTVWSLTEHWSVGGFLAAQRSNYYNYDFQITASPAIEYNIFPYNESNNHYLGFMYRVGPVYADYQEETIYFETSELRLHQNLSLDVSFNQKWGQVSGSAAFGHYFHDFSKNRLSFSGYADLRLYKGFSLNFSGYYALQRDQLNIVKGNITNEDLLTRRRQLDSNYSFYTSFGIRYRFGSLSNNVVNPRFGGGGGMIIF